MGERSVENRQIFQVIESIENNIEKCAILRSILKSRIAGDNIDFCRYLDNNYKSEEIEIGAELIDLYLKLKNYVKGREQ